jgi:UDP-glucose 6-dehydrogenase
MRDLKAVGSLVPRSFVPAEEFLNAIEKISNIRRTWLLNQILYLNLKKDDLVFFCGLSYKYGTNSVSNSPAYLALNKLLSDGQKILFFDPYIISEKLQEKREYDLVEGIRKSNIIVLSQFTHEFSYFMNSIPPEELKNKVLIDPFGILRKHQSSFATYKSLG